MIKEMNRKLVDEKGERVNKYRRGESQKRCGF